MSDRAELLKNLSVLEEAVEKLAEPSRKRRSGRVRKARNFTREADGKLTRTLTCYVFDVGFWSNQLILYTFARVKDGGREIWKIVELYLDYSLDYTGDVARKVNAIVSGILANKLVRVKVRVTKTNIVTAILDVDTDFDPAVKIIDIISSDNVIGLTYLVRVWFDPEGGITRRRGVIYFQRLLEVAESWSQASGEVHVESLYGRVKWTRGELGFISSPTWSINIHSIYNKYIRINSPEDLDKPCEVYGIAVIDGTRRDPDTGYAACTGVLFIPLEVLEEWLRTKTLSDRLYRFLKWCVDTLRKLREWTDSGRRATPPAEINPLKTPISDGDYSEIHRAVMEELRDIPDCVVECTDAVLQLLDELVEKKLVGKLIAERVLEEIDKYVEECCVDDPFKTLRCIILRSDKLGHNIKRVLLERLRLAKLTVDVKKQDGDDKVHQSPSTDIEDTIEDNSSCDGRAESKSSVKPDADALTEGNSDRDGSASVVNVIVSRDALRHALLSTGELSEREVEYIVSALGETVEVSSLDELRQLLHRLVDFSKLSRKGKRVAHRVVDENVDEIYRRLLEYQSGRSQDATSSGENSDSKSTASEDTGTTMKCTDVDVCAREVARRVAELVRGVVERGEKKGELKLTLELDEYTTAEVEVHVADTEGLVVPPVLSAVDEVQSWVTEYVKYTVTSGGCYLHSCCDSATVELGNKTIEVDICVDKRSRRLIIEF